MLVSPDVPAMNVWMATLSIDGLVPETYICVGFCDSMRAAPRRALVTIDWLRKMVPNSKMPSSRTTISGATMASSMITDPWSERRRGAGAGRRVRVRGPHELNFWGSIWATLLLFMVRELPNSPVIHGWLMVT